ncbi:50S ribosomal protein L4 [Candidatus Poriferisodalis sp.]|uniref:50S ribosomal protein L4 n=1 Tax=Candidatus Poriferisodalis sp. TaxID=3101277 RepID=UPI003B0281C5
MTLTLDVRTPDGSTVGSVELDEAIFGIEPNMAALHQAVTAQLAARRSGSHSTLTRSEVRGGGAKPWRQKGTGRARQGSIRSPQWAGGGVAHGPKPRDYRQKVNRKTVRLALRSALSDRARSERVVVIDEWNFAQPRTKDAIAVLENLSLSGQVLLVLDDSASDQAAHRSFRNLPDVRSLRYSELNAYDILRSDWLVFTRDTLPASDPPAGNSPTAGEGTEAAATPSAQPETAGPPNEGDDQ